jgi:4-hydroxybenzoate polyprenyltransferase
MPPVIRRFFELIRFSHTIFALPFALLSAWLAWQTTPFRIQDLVGILLCMVFARSAAMAFNRIADRDLDAANPRTAARHIPAGLLSLRSVANFTLACCVLFVASTLLFLPNRWPLVLSVPVLLFLLGYSYAKRFTTWCHYWLSAALMLSPIAAWIAITGRVDPTPLLIAGAVFFWVGGFDIIYACQDAEFDRSRTLRSVPARWGIERALWIARISHLVTVAFLFALWHVAGLGVVFLLGVIAALLLLIYEHWLVRSADLGKVNLAFFQVNAVISLGLLLVAIIDRLSTTG